MGRIIYFINTIGGLEEDLNKAASKYIPSGYEIKHITDQSLIQHILKNNGVTPYIYKRLTDHAIAAEQSGAMIIQYSCSTISHTIDTVQKFVNIPILPIDAPVIKKTLLKYKKIGLIATNPATLNPSRESVKMIADKLKCNPKIKSVLCQNAFEALLDGNKIKHDTLVKKDLISLSKKVDAIILAQASMTRIVNSLSPNEIKIPIFSSINPAMNYLSNTIKKL